MRHSEKKKRKKYHALRKTKWGIIKAKDILRKIQKRSGIFSLSDKEHIIDALYHLEKIDILDLEMGLSVLGGQLSVKEISNGNKETDNNEEETSTEEKYNESENNS